MIRQGKSSYSIYLPAPIILNQVVPSLFKVFIDRCQIPFSFSQFSSIAQNIQCDFTITRNSIPYDGSFSVVEGNYNILSLADEFVNKLKSECNTVSGYTPPITYGYSADTNHLRFYLLPDATTTFITIKNSPYYRLNEALGFNTQWVMDDSIPYTESTIDCDVSPSRSLYFTSTTLQQTQSWSAITTSFQTNSILTQIPIEREPLLFITHKPNYPIKTTLTNTSISELQIGIRDEQLNELQDFELPFSFHLVIEEVRVEPYLAMETPTDLQQKLSPEEIDRRRKLLEEYKKQQEDALTALKDDQQKRLDKYIKKLNKK
jgi:hypothetical protein